ncbi:MAG: xanthine dehydrogenase accessory protein XdhC [Woeseiaceae bacterium]|nr:xanthine dehydrogenase accessory protein XdhC [Woeseiaceae bacterium]NIP21870.1 xanthine dehydrogenase accessory protein XdhC [Woeseiaceae bacterium]NIS90955.1 xanthine dehydrogenase accessory protein XdhC [Woeseiaceae bacterium]
MNEWIDELCDLTAAGERAVLVTVAGIRGSAPREVGAKMIVSADATIGTIGGGQLEYQCTRIAAGMLGDDETPALRKFPLGSSMGQCCGGVVDILFEPIASRLPGWLRDLRTLHGQREPAVIVTHLRGDTDKCIITTTDAFGDAATAQPDVVTTAREGLETGRRAHRIGDWFFEDVVGTDFNIAVFGAGHVGSAVVRSLSALDCNVRWIDSRRNIFRDTPANVRAIESSEPALEVAAMPPGSCFLVMTHSHAIDYEICNRILRRGDAVYCGLIGSISKRRRFEKRFRAEGMQERDIEQLVCPIGVDGITGKKPAEIAVAAAAEVLQAWERVNRAAEPKFPANVRPLKRRR